MVGAQDILCYDPWRACESCGVLGRWRVDRECVRVRVMVKGGGGGGGGE